MLIPLGILAASGAAELSDYELIESAILTANQSSVTFSNLGTYASEYNHLQIRYAAKATSVNTSMGIRFNGVTTNSYARHALLGNGSTVSSTNQANIPEMYLSEAMSSSSTANAFATGVIDILDAYNTSKNTTIRCLYGQSDSLTRIFLSSGLFNNTAAINSITLRQESNAIATGSRFSLYGIKG